MASRKPRKRTLKVKPLKWESPFVEVPVPSTLKIGDILTPETKDALKLTTVCQRAIEAHEAKVKTDAEIVLQNETDFLKRVFGEEDAGLISKTRNSQGHYLICGHAFGVFLSYHWNPTPVLEPIRSTCYPVLIYTLEDLGAYLKAEKDYEIREVNRAAHTSLSNPLTLIQKPLPWYRRLWTWLTLSFAPTPL